MVVVKHFIEGRVDFAGFEVYCHKTNVETIILEVTFYDWHYCSSDWKKTRCLRICLKGLKELSKEVFVSESHTSTCRRKVELQ